MSFEQLLVMHASPTLANMKPSSLISASHVENESECIAKLERRGLQFLLLANMKGQRLIFVYRQAMLEKALSSPLAAEILKYLGYPDTIDARLSYLKERFLSSPCPHEVGLFLGYPPEDVKGFIENRGCNALCSGIWKVYSNPEEAERILAKWSKCRMKYIECFIRGTDIAKLCVTA